MLKGKKFDAFSLDWDMLILKVQIFSKIIKRRMNYSNKQQS